MNEQLWADIAMAMGKWRVAPANADIEPYIDELLMAFLKEFGQFNDGCYCCAERNFYEALGYDCEAGEDEPAWTYTYTKREQQ